MFPPTVNKYLLSSLSGTPDVLERLVRDLPADDPTWDFRPDPERFTLREVLAHLADWEPIHLERLIRIRDEQTPDLPDIDEGQLAVENDYSHSDPQASLEWFRGGRQKVVQLLASLAPEMWERTGNRLGIGMVSIETLSVLILAHDGHHVHQIVQWLAKSEPTQSAEKV